MESTRPRLLGVRLLLLGLAGVPPLAVGSARRCTLAHNGDVFGACCGFVQSVSNQFIFNFNDTVHTCNYVFPSCTKLHVISSYQCCLYKVVCTTCIILLSLDMRFRNVVYHDQMITKIVLHQHHLRIFQQIHHMCRRVPPKVGHRPQLPACPGGRRLRRGVSCVSMNCVIAMFVRVSFNTKLVSRLSVSVLDGSWHMCFVS